MSIQKFRKKPVVIEAVQLTLGNWSEACDFVTTPGFRGVNVPPNNDKIAAIIPTLEGEMRADENDWIIKGVNGEFYPCKPDVFEKTYEVVKDAHSD